MLFASTLGTSLPPRSLAHHGVGGSQGCSGAAGGASLGSAPAQSREEEEKPPSSAVPPLPTCAWSLASSPTKGFPMRELLGREMEQMEGLEEHRGTARRE